MSSLALWVDKPYMKNELFNINSELNRDDCLGKYRLLKEYMNNLGWSVDTHDAFSGERSPDAIFFMGVPKKPLKRLVKRQLKINDISKIKMYVILSECEVVDPNNWNISLHDQFDCIFTWSKRFYDRDGYANVNFVSTKECIGATTRFNDKKLCVNVSCNKKSSHALELYSKRVEVIRWFERFHPDDFDLFGYRWDSYVFESSRIGNVIGRLKFLRPLYKRLYPSYVGSIKDKYTVVSRYKFSICFENAKSIPDYITEKIFDSFVCGCIPVYMGAPNIEAKIPKACYVLMDDFESYSELYEYLSGMTENRYKEYIQNIEAYLKSEEFYLYTKSCFAKTIGETVNNVS